MRAAEVGGPKRCTWEGDENRNVARCGDEHQIQPPSCRTVAQTQSTSTTSKRSEEMPHYTEYDAKPRRGQVVMNFFGRCART